jgi:hypothetical protein
MSQDMGHDEEVSSKCAISKQGKHYDDDVLLALSLRKHCFYVLLARCNFLP